MAYARVFSLVDRDRRFGSGRRYYKLVSYHTDLFHFPDGTPPDAVRERLSTQPACMSKVAFEYEGVFYLLDTHDASNPVIRRRVQECVKWHQKGKTGYVIYQRDAPAYRNYTGEPLTLFGRFDTPQLTIPACKIVLSCEAKYSDSVVWAKPGSTTLKTLTPAGVQGIPIYSASVVMCDPLPASLEPYDFAIVTLAYARAYRHLHGQDPRLLVPCQPMYSASGNLLGYRGLCHPV